MDAFGGLGQFSKNPDKMTLAERQRAAATSKSQQQTAQRQQWSGLDSLGSLGGSLNTITTTKPAPASNFDLLGDFSSPTASSVTKPVAKPATHAPPTSSSLLDDFDVFTSAPPKQNTGPTNTDPFAIFEKPQAPSQRQLQPQSLSQSQPRSHPHSRVQTPMESGPSPHGQPGATKNDSAVAQLVDMGFTDVDAARALEAMDGSVKGAINYLMAEAQGRPVPKPKPKGHSQDEVLAMAQDVGASMFAAASSLWSKGRKQIQKTYDTYQGNGAQSADGQPAWMRSQARYMEKESQLRENTPPVTQSQTGTAAPRVQQTFNDELPARRRTFNDELPTRRREPSSPAPSTGAVPKSRAELFREKQAQRSTPQGSPSIASPVLSSTVGSADGSNAASAVGSSQSSRVASPKPAPMRAPEPEIDLLGMSSSPVATALSSTQADMMATSRTAGTDAFKRGDYSGATTYFTSSLESVPKGHMLRTILLANRSAALLKVGDAHGALEDTNEALNIINMKVVGRNNTQEVEAGKQLSDIWLKLIVRRAQAYEHLEKYTEALESWKLLLNNGYSHPTHLDGKRRCQAAIDIKNKPTKPVDAAPKAVPEKKTQRRGWGTTGAGPQSAEGKAAVEKVRSLNKKQEQNDKERAELQESVTARIDTWKAGKENDLRALLSTIQTVLWKECQWTPVTSADLVSPKKCRIVYMKAVAKTHPDKIPSSASTQVKMISETVFITLNKAWEPFREANGL